MSNMISRRAVLTGLAAASLGARQARAAEKLRVGKAVAEVFGYVPLDVGMTYGIFEKHGLDIDELIFAGGNKMVQAMVAGGVDIALSSGAEIALVGKGAPEIAVATITDSPAFMAIVVGSQYHGDGVDSLKGKKIGVTTSGSLTEWIVEELNLARGWTGGDRAQPVAIGGSPTAAFAALKLGQIDADIGGLSTGYQLEELYQGRLLIDCSAYIKSIQLFTIFASNAIVRQNPDAVRRFVKGWLESVAFMQTHRAESIPIAVKSAGWSTGVSERTYDAIMAKFSPDGRFRAEAMETLRQSFADLKTLPEPIDISKFYTEQFLPGT